MTDFDKQIDRNGSYSTKWQYYMAPDKSYVPSPIAVGTAEGEAIPMWIADMDYECAKPITDAVKKAAAHGIYGYSRDVGSYRDSVVRWFGSQHQWTVESESIVLTTGIIPALNVAVQAFVKPGEKVLLQGPVYYPFYSVIRLQGVSVVSNALVNNNGRYEMDFDDLEIKLADPDLKMALFCNPHNPGGTVWRPDELSRFAELCIKHEVLIVSDEVHGDLTFSESKFTPLLALNADYAQHTIVCTSPSKAFNIAGLQSSNIIIPNENLRRKFSQRLLGNGISGLNPFALAATEAAYNQGEQWLSECVAYLQANRDHALDFFATHLPQIDVIKPEATYLLWMDCRSLELSTEALHLLFNRTAKVYLDDGEVFGEEGKGFVRMNFACTKNTLDIALNRIRQVLINK